MSLAPTVEQQNCSRAGEFCSCWRASVSMSCNWPSCGGTEPAQAPRAGQSPAPCGLEIASSMAAGAGEQQEGDGDPGSAPRARAVRSWTGRRASGTPPTSTGAVAVPAAGAGARLGGVNALRLVGSARSGGLGNYSERAAPRKRRKQKPSMESAIRRGMVGIAFAGRDRSSPEAQRSADRGSAISAETLPTLPSSSGGRRPRRWVGWLAVARRCCTGWVQGAVTCFGGMKPSSKLQLQVASGGTGAGQPRHHRVVLGAR